MRAGELRQRITVQTPSAATPDGDGGFTQTWSTLAQVWASITPATARDLERTIAGTVQSMASHLITMRHLAGVTTTARVLFGSRTFQVTGVANPEERNISLVLVCKEVVS